MLGSLVSVLAFASLDLPASLPVLFWSPPGWNQYVNLVEWALDSLATLFNNAGLAIIVFTILVKTVLMPLTVQSLRSSKAMQELQPKIKELQKKHGKDRQRLTQETMRLYSEHRVNPMSGCLPMLLQIPIFFGLYQAIRNLSGGGEGSALWDGGFLWLDNLHQADPIHLLPVLAGGFQFVQTKMMRPYNQGKITDPQQALMNQMMNFMPITVVIFGWGFDSGPVLYWATQSIFSVVQQWFITGWGSLRDWFPNLPELPEHRRLGYRAPRALDDVVVVSGDEDGAPVRAPGLMGWAQDKLQASQQRAAARPQGPAGSGAGGLRAVPTRSGNGGRRRGGSGSGAGNARGRRPAARTAPREVRRAATARPTAVPPASAPSRARARGRRPAGEPRGRGAAQGPPCAEGEGLGSVGCWGFGAGRLGVGSNARVRA